MSPRIALIISVLIPIMGIAGPAPVTTADLLSNLSPTEPWDKGKLTATKTVNFEQTDSGATNATSIAKITLAYFTSNDCTGAPAGDGFYTTPDGSSYSISLSNPFGLVAASTWNVGSSQLNIADMTSINSVAIVFKSTNNEVPQSNFSGSSFDCIAVTCASNACTSAENTQSFSLKTTPAIGDPANGGVLACYTGLGDAFDLVAPQNDITFGEPWGPNSSSMSAFSDDDGDANTSAIVAFYGTGSTYMARTCDEYQTSGGFTTGWFLPAVNQLVCLFNNRFAIGGFTTSGTTRFYLASTESSEDNTRAVRVSFGSAGNIRTGSKTATNRRGRCVKAL